MILVSALVLAASGALGKSVCTAQSWTLSELNLFNILNLKK